MEWLFYILTFIVLPLPAKMRALMIIVLMKNLRVIGKGGSFVLSGWVKSSGELLNKIKKGVWFDRVLRRDKGKDNRQ